MYSCRSFFQHHLKATSILKVVTRIKNDKNVHFTLNQKMPIEGAITDVHKQAELVFYAIAD